jgi:glycosyltransferase involved in cell wall biosynthesis
MELDQLQVSDAFSNFERDERGLLRTRLHSAGSAPFRIVHAAETSGGGLATYIGHLIKMQRDFFGPGCITAILPESQSQFMRSVPGVEVLTFDDSAGRVVNAFRLARRLKEFVNGGQPNVVHLHSTFAGAVLRPMLLKLKSKTKIIYCPHGWAFDRKMSSYAQYGAKWIERKLAPLCHAIVCISYHEVRAARQCGIAPEKLVLVRNGVPMVAPTPAIDPASIAWPEGKRRILFVGRFDRQKGVDVLLRAVSELKDQVFACIVGDSVVDNLPVASDAENVRLCGWLSPAQLEAYYQSADVVVIPSRWEGFGLVAAEAMRAGLPVIASNVGGLTEIVDDGVTGILIPTDDEKVLVQTLRDLTDAHLRAMGKAGRERFLRDFTMERTHREICELYFKSEDAAFGAPATLQKS